MSPAVAPTPPRTPALFCRPGNPASFAMDLSRAGAGFAIACNDAPEVGSKLNLDVALPGEGRPFRVAVRVISTAGRGGRTVVVKFFDPDSRAAQWVMRNALRLRAAQ